MSTRQFEFSRHIAEDMSFFYVFDHASCATSRPISEWDSSSFLEILFTHSLLQVREFESAQRDKNTISIVGTMIPSGILEVYVVNRYITNIRTTSTSGRIDLYVPLEPERLAEELREWCLTVVP